MQMCAHLLERGELELLQRMLKPFTSANVARSRESNDKLNATKGFTRVSIQLSHCYSMLLLMCGVAL
jgi:hypothetical protein